MCSALTRSLLPSPEVPYANGTVAAISLQSRVRYCCCYESPTMEPATKQEFTISVRGSPVSVGSSRTPLQQSGSQALSAEKQTSCKAHQLENKAYSPA